MNEETELWKKHREASQKKKKENAVYNGLLLLGECTKRGIDFTVKNRETHHYKVGPYDFWSSTGLFIHSQTNKRGRGIRNLLKLL